MLTYYDETDKGGRDINEDSLEKDLILECPSGKIHLFAVADGLGGQNAGEFAGKLAILELRETIKRNISGYEAITLEVMRELLAKAFRKANEEICYHAKIFPEKRGMGTTLVAALLDDEGRGWVANVGDSRAYLIGDCIRRVTKDHSYVQELVDRGLISHDEAQVHPEKNIVTKIIGMEGAEPDFYSVEIGKNTLLLCSDGLTDGLGENVIMQIVLFTETEDICRNLVLAAKSKSRDNITVVLVRVGDNLRKYGDIINFFDTSIN